MTFSSRRRLGLLILAVLTLLFWLVDSILEVSLHSSQFFTGWTLLLTMVALALFNIRKKLSFLPIGTGSSWAQFHIYAGFFTIPAFIIHTGWRIPQGTLEVTMTILFLGVVLSGIFGLLLSRILPSRLNNYGENMLYEKIPIFRRQLNDELNELVLRSVKDLNSCTVADFYAAQLLSYFSKPRHFFHHLFQSSSPLQSLLGKIEAHRQYSSLQEQEVFAEISELVKLKDNLDYQYSLQSVLKYWLFVHIPLTYSLMIFAPLHLILAYKFFGGIR